MPRVSLGRLLTACVVCMSWPLYADEPPRDPPPAEPGQVSADQEQAPPKQFIYQPPNRGAPTQRVGGGTRSIAQLEVLAPDHTALTTRAQPRLYWYISPGFQNNIRFRLGMAGVTPPLFEILLPPEPNGGIQAIDLAAHDVRLEPGRLYEWAVMLEPFPHQRVPPLVSLGRIVVDTTASALQAAPLAERPFLAASNGYWYDALDWVSQLIDSGAPKALALQRAALLDQGGLTTAAHYERDMARLGR